MNKYKLLIVLVLFCKLVNAQNDYGKLLKEIWERDACSLEPHRDIIAHFILEKQIVSNSDELISLLGYPLQINHRNSGEKYYVYKMEGRRNYFYNCAVFSLIMFKINKKRKLEDVIYCFIADSEEAVHYWSSSDLPIESYEDDEREPFPFINYGGLDIKNLDKKGKGIPPRE